MVASLVSFYPTLIVALSQANYTIFPDDNGVPFLVKIDETPLALEEQLVLAASLDTISFTLFTKANPKAGQIMRQNDLLSVQDSNWASRKPTIFVTHGWHSAGNTTACTLIRDAFLKVLDCNVIVVDWSVIASNMIYSVSAKSVPDVAKHVASFANYLRTNAGLNTSITKFVGHSLGAHVASLSAHIVSKSSLVSEVVALDPAKPMFENKGPDGRVDRSHAKNVQVVHTCAGRLGMDKSIGTSDFYANGGKSQPGCSNDIIGNCAHTRSYHYFSESIMNTKGFPGTPPNGGNMAYMGGSNLDPRAKGNYNFKTASQAPFALDDSKKE